MPRGLIIIITLILALAIFFAVLQAMNILPAFSLSASTPSADNIKENEEQAHKENITLEPDPEPEPEPDLRSSQMVVVGDITAHIPQISQAENPDGSYNFNPSFEIIAPYLQAADLAVGDLETCQAGPDIRSLGWGVSGYTGYPEFNAPDQFAEALQAAGFDALSFANNHTLDRGYDGVVRTLTHVRSLGIDTFGSYKSWEERNSPLIIDIDGLKIAFLGYTYGTNGIPVLEGHEYSVNLVTDFNDISQIIADIKTARDNGADLVAIFPHWGQMYVSEPQPQRLREVAAELAAAGADLILGGHPHYIQPVEWFFNQNEDGRERATLAVYSLGNFISNQNRRFDHITSPFVEFGLMLDIEIIKDMDNDKAWISDVDYEITWVNIDWRHRIIPLNELFAGMPEDYNLSAAQVEDLKLWDQRNREVVEAYGHSEDLERVRTISEALIKDAGR